ncbi:MAG: hypothetical protein RQ867_02675 [Mariprofundaceae bacterium]|nr:hypothetical protein [Mariprofundaceae bacterium]
MRYFNMLMTVTVMCLTSCTNDNPDLSGDGLWNSQCVTFSKGQYQACYGPGWDAYSPRNESHYDFYQISVEKNIAKGGHLVLFDEKYAFDKIDTDIIRRDEKDIMKIDEDSKSVTFYVTGRAYIRID